MRATHAAPPYEAVLLHSAQLLDSLVHAGQPSDISACHTTSPMSFLAVLCRFMSVTLTPESGLCLDPLRIWYPTLL
jgi:hypothetical protein